MDTNKNEYIYLDQNKEVGHQKIRFLMHWNYFMVLGHCVTLCVYGFNFGYWDQSW